jgi:hypothetical protein
VEFATAADELYGVPPAEFTATRKRLAGELSREEGRRLTALRKPTVPAWAVNQLVRDDAVGPLLDLGERMRTAWSDGGDLASLERERNSLVPDLLRRARELADDAGRPLSDAFADEVEETLRAAIADPSAAEAVRAGRLDHPLRHAGFGTFGAASPPAKKPPAKKHAEKGTTKKEREERERQRRAAQREEKSRAADRKAEVAERSLAEWESALEEAQGRLSEADDELGELRERLRDAEARRADLDRKAQVAEREHDRAARAAEDARRKARQLARDQS